MSAFSSAAFSTNAFSINAFFFDSGSPGISWIDGVGYGGVGGSGVVSIAHNNSGGSVSTVSQDQMDSTVRRWKA